MRTILDYKLRKRSDEPIFFFNYWEGGDIKYQGYCIGLRRVRGGRRAGASVLFGDEPGPYATSSSFFDKCTFYDCECQMRRAYDNRYSNQEA